MKSLEQQWNEFFFFGGPMPAIVEDRITVPYPIRPIPVKHIPNTQVVTVRVK